jgi:DNA-binding MarR family transcriptional regulator
MAARKDADNLGPCACFRARTMARAITALYDQVLESSGLRISQFAILTTIGSRGAVTMQELAGDLGLDPSTMTRTLQPLQRDGYVTAEQGEDRRVRELALTPRGHRKLSELTELWAKAQDELRNKVGEERFERLVGDMAAVVSALRQ